MKPDPQSETERSLERLAPELKPFLELELRLGNAVRDAYTSVDGQDARVNLVRPLHVDALKSGPAWPAGVEIYETWGPHTPVELGLATDHGPHILAGPHPLFERMRPWLEELAREWAEKRFAAIAARSDGGVTEDAVRRAVQRLSRRGAGRPALPPPEACESYGSGTGRGSVLVCPDGERNWKVFFDSWTIKGRQRGLAFAVRVRESPEGELSFRLVGFAEGAAWPEDGQGGNS